MSYRKALLVVLVLGLAVVAAAVIVPNLGRIEVRNGHEREPFYELGLLSVAIAALMADNKLASIPSPKSSGKEEGCAIGYRDMTRFPDESSVAGSSAKSRDPAGALYQHGDKNGYLFSLHDRVADNSQSGLINYVSNTRANFCYLVSSEGRLQQYDQAGKPLGERDPNLALGVLSLTPYYPPTPTPLGAPTPVPGYTPAAPLVLLSPTPILVPPPPVPTPTPSGTQASPTPVLAPLSDLTLCRIDVPASAIEICNLGPQPVPPAAIYFAWSPGWYTKPGWNSESLIWTVAQGPFPVGKTLVVPLAAGLDAGAQFMVDSTRAVAESNEANNCLDVNRREVQCRE